MKKLIIILSLFTCSLLAAPQDYSYKVLEIKEGKDKTATIIESVYLKVHCELGADFAGYSEYLDPKQLALYKADKNNISKICEDFFAIAKARLDLQIEQKPKEVIYNDTQKEAITVDKAAINTKAETIKDDQKEIIKE